MVEPATGQGVPGQFQASATFQRQPRGEFTPIMASCHLALGSDLELRNQSAINSKTVQPIPATFAV